MWWFGDDDEDNDNDGGRGKASEETDTFEETTRRISESGETSPQITMTTSRRTSYVSTLGSTASPSISGEFETRKENAYISSLSSAATIFTTTVTPSTTKKRSTVATNFQASVKGLAAAGDTVTTPDVDKSLFEKRASSVTTAYVDPSVPQRETTTKGDKSNSYDGDDDDVDVNEYDKEQAATGSPDNEQFLYVAEDPRLTGTGWEMADEDEEYIDQFPGGSGSGEMVDVPETTFPPVVDVPETTFPTVTAEICHNTPNYMCSTGIIKDKESIRDYWLVSLSGVVTLSSFPTPPDSLFSACVSSIVSLRIFPSLCLIFYKHRYYKK